MLKMAMTKVSLHSALAGEDYSIATTSVVAVDERHSVAIENDPAKGELFDMYELLSNAVDRVGEEFRRNDQPEGLALYVYIGFVVGGGILLNLILIKGILQAKYSGALYFVLQIAILDICSLLISIWELFYIVHQRWIFESEHCTFYIGFESFTNIAIVYFIIGLNFHSISTYNLAQQMSTACDDLTSSYHDNSESNSDYMIAEENNYEVATENIIQKRSLTIDYRHRKTNISVLWPVMLIWFIAMSESLPLFLFSDVTSASANEGVRFCTILINDRTNHYIIQWLIIVIRIAIPTVTLLVTTVIIIFKFYQGRSFTQPTEIDENVAFILKVAIFLSLTYAIFSIQKLYGSLLFEVLSKPILRYKYPTLDRQTGLIFTFLHYCLSFVRPLVVIILCKLKHNHVDITFIYRSKKKITDLS
ncbi:uncharacterized protein LOC128741891 [Sabethes cyaneus]|uniref:uncharacterized protein LOC128741891 n=1 Tax=Sabethes cyaneus TaxID=53552 RepID=UPI00237DC4AE|nr:uncharacterized protein LOC128741891 [Sabethes cyaneus]